MKYFKFSLKAKIIGMVIGLLLLVGIGTGSNVLNLGKHYEEGIKQSFSSIINAGADFIAAQFFERYGDVQAFAKNSAIQSLNSTEMVSSLDQYIELYGLYDVILVVDKNGKFIASNSKDATGTSVNTAELKNKNYSHEPWFQAVIQGRFTEDLKKGYKGTFVEPWLKDPLAQLAFGEMRVGSSFSAAIKDQNGNIVGVITNRASGRWLTNEFEHLSDLMKGIGADGNIVLTDSKGILLWALNSEKKPILQDQIFKKDMSQSSEIVRKALTVKSGIAELYSETLQAQAVTAFTNLDSPKWIESIGWQLIVLDHRADLLAPALSAERNFAVVFVMTLFISLVAAIWFGIAVGKMISKVTNSLEKNTEDVSRESISLAASSTELSEASTEQAAALQETVAAVDEIFAMVEKNADAANRSMSYSHQSREAAQQGKTIVENMLNAIAEIDAANNQVSDRIETNNSEISSITNLIKEIGSKTKVINDIVFQTKLLSFNASVEAARAGEYGKGFAVVAEEVGSLAQMSGNAAKEISGLLDESVRKVETIVNTSKAEVDKLMIMNKQKVDSGSKTAHECASALDEIIQNVSSVDTMVGEIAAASKEQSLGIKEISKAVGQMEQVIQQNTAVAQSSTSSSEKLRSQAEELQSIVNDLQIIVNGEASSEYNLKEKSAGDETEKDNVVRFTKKSRPSKRLNKLDSFAKSADEKVERKEANFDLHFGKIAAGGDFVPSANDPGFNEQ